MANCLLALLGALIETNHVGIFPKKKGWGAWGARGASLLPELLCKIWRCTSREAGGWATHSTFPKPVPSMMKHGAKCALQSKWSRLGFCKDDQGSEVLRDSPKIPEFWCWSWYSNFTRLLIRTVSLNHAYWCSKRCGGFLTYIPTHFFSNKTLTLFRWYCIFPYLLGCACLINQVLFVSVSISISI